MYGLSVDDTSYHIAIIDDESGEREKLRSLIAHYFDQYPNKVYEICMYEDGEELLRDLAAGKYFDLFFLDVELEEEQTGINLAYQIRSFYLEPVIIYVTNHLECAPQAFEVNAYRFIPKRMLSEKITEALDYVLGVIDRIDQRFYVVDTSDCAERILLKNIVSIEKEEKYINIHYRNGVVRERKTLDKVMKSLASSEFVYVDKSDIVNLRQIESIRKDQLVLKDGRMLRISRPRYRKVRELLIAYWRSEE